VESDIAQLATRALDLVPDGARIGLGTGRAATAFVHALAARVRQGLRVHGVPTSEGTARLARDLGIPLDTLDPPEPLVVTVDGADEVERGSLFLIKGWGGALVRERIVAAAARAQVILVTAEKLVERLGSRGKLPVEVLPFAAHFCRRRIEHLGFKSSLRESNGPQAEPFVSDNGNWILDCSVAALDSPVELERSLRAIPGVVDTGLFLGTVAVVLAAEGGVIHEWRPRASSSAPGTL
jgi:ribose 5-phosphate isomerase A